MERKRQNAAHIRNLILLAIRDNNFDEKEMKLIVKIAIRLELSCLDFEKLIESQLLRLEIPDQIYERIEQLNDMVSVMKTDGVIHIEEVKLIEQFAKYYGFGGENEIIDFNLNFDDVRNHKSFKKFMNVFKNMTGENMSEVRVDNDFRILFPLYKAELKVGPIAKALYVFFLKKPNGCLITELQNKENWELLSYIYRNMPNAHQNVVERIDGLTHPLGLRFNENSCRINKTLKGIIPCEKLEAQYKIMGGKNEPKLIPLKQELIFIQPAI